MAARIAAGVGAVAGVGYYLRNRTTVGGVTAAATDRNARQALGVDSKNDKGIADTVKGAYGGKTGGNTSLGQKSAD